jgi:four helix bundle protein
LDNARRRLIRDIPDMVTEPYEKLEAWQLAHQLALQVYEATERWPRSERFELTTQARRAALSVPANIAEGVGRHGARELRRYINVARASLTELSYLLRFARDRGLLVQQDFVWLDDLRNRVGRLTWGMLRAMGT